MHLMAIVVRNLSLTTTAIQFREGKPDEGRGGRMQIQWSIETLSHYIKYT